MKRDNDYFFAWFNRLRHVIEASVAFKLTYYALFLKYVEINNFTSYKEPYSLSYLSMLYGDRIDENAITQYLYDIEKELLITGGIISQSFSDLLKRVSDKKAVKDILSMVYELNIDSNQKIVEIFDEVMELEYTYAGKSGGEYSTNKSLAKLESKLLNVTAGSQIYDGYCGYGTSICEASKEDTQLFIRDINTEALSIATINLIIHGKNIKNVTCGDSNFDCENKYKYVISEPPFNIHRDDEYIIHLNSVLPIVSRTTVEIERSIQSLSDDGRAVILVPTGFLFRSSTTAELRKNLIEKNEIEAVIELPENVLSGTGVRTAILVINKQKKNDKVYIMDSSSFWTKEARFITRINDENIATIIEMINEQKDVPGMASLVDHKKIAENDFNLTPSWYIMSGSSEGYIKIDCADMIENGRKLEKEVIKICEELDILRS